MGGGFSPPATSWSLARFDPDQLTIDRNFTFPSLAETAGSGVGGITWDGQSIWIAVAGNTNKLVRVDPSNGEISRTMSAPTVLGPPDLEFDGDDLWLSSGTGDLFLISRTTGGIDRRLPIPNGFSGRDDGVAVRPCELWVNGLFGGLQVEDPKTGAVTANVINEDGSEIAREQVGSSTFVGDQLVIVGELGITFYDLQ